MGFLGLGAPEMLIIAVIALVIFGPNRLPEVAGQIGKVVRDIRKVTGELTSELEKNADLKDIKNAVQKELGGIQSQVNAASAAVNKEVKTATSSVKSATSATTATAAKSVTASAGASASSAAKAVAAKVVATKRDPLADVTFFELPDEKSPEAAASVQETATGVVPTTSIGQLDAVSRARQRRAAAGYNQRAS